MSIHSDLPAVSDTSSGNASYDKSGPTIKEIIQQKDGYQVVQAHCHIVPDDAERILLVVRDICNSDAVDWLISTGGTGFGVRDVTPEASMDVFIITHVEDGVYSGHCSTHRTPRARSRLPHAVFFLQAYSFGRSLATCCRDLQEHFDNHPSRKRQGRQRKP